MAYETIKYEKEDHVAIVTLNRPHRLNSMSPQLVNELVQVIDEIDKDDNVRCFIITGARRPDGRPMFSPGADLKELAGKGITALGPENILDRLEGVFGWAEPTHAIQLVFEKIEAMWKPSIAAIDGICTAGGIELANSCDLRVVAETAQISDIHMKNLGQIGGSGAGVRLVRIVGPAKAKELLFTSDVIDGKEALRIGYANKCFPPDKMMAGAKELAHKIAGMKPEGLRMAKLTLDTALDMPLRQAVRFSYACYMAPQYTLQDKMAGAMAFAEKKAPPRF